MTKPAAPSNEQPATEETPAPKWATAEDVNRAVTERINRLVEKQLPDIIAKSLAPVMERMKPQEQSSTEAPATGGATDIEKRFQAQLRAQDENFKKQLAEERAQRQAVEDKRLRDEERMSLAEALEAAGVNDPVLKKAAAATFTAEGRVIRTEDGAIRFKMPRTGYTEDVDLVAGVKEWAATDEGKKFRAPTGAQGSGATGGKAARNGKPADKKADAVATLNSLLFGNGPVQ